MALASLAQASAPYASKATAYAQKAALQAGRNYWLKYGAPMSTAFMVGAEASREYKRSASINAENVLTDDEYALLASECGGCEPRMVRVCYTTVRLSREGMAAKVEPVVKGLVGRFRHWSLEVGGVYYELREQRPAKVGADEEAGEEETDGDGESEGARANSTVIFRELGEVSRKIKLEVTTNRVMHPRVEIEDTGFMTTLSEECIITLASKIFGSFSADYDLWIDNCQHFTQLLAESICPLEERDQVRAFFDKRSVMTLGVAASWFVAPVYGVARAVHYGLDEGSSAKKEVSKVLEGLENFYLHPRVFGGRRKVKWLH